LISFNLLSSRAGSTGFPKRDNASHRADGYKYANLKSEAARTKFAKEHAARWSEFARLPYFDLVRMIVIDPMHNLLLGELFCASPVLC
jgi:hypothetical protein